MDAYRLALNQARNELSDAQLTLRSLMLRVSQLESVVSQLEALTSGMVPSYETPKPTPEVPPLLLTAKPTSEPPIPLWKAIISALNGKKSDFTVPEAIAALERTGRHIASPNRVNIVRNTMIQNKNFGRLGPGHYYVVGYETSSAEANEKEATEVAS